MSSAFEEAMREIVRDEMVRNLNSILDRFDAYPYRDALEHLPDGIPDSLVHVMIRVTKSQTEADHIRKRFDEIVTSVSGDSGEASETSENVEALVRSALRLWTSASTDGSQISFDLIAIDTTKKILDLFERK